MVEPEHDADDDARWHAEHIAPLGRALLVVLVVAAVVVLGGRARR